MKPARILVVDDDDGVRSLVEEVLTAQGHDVVTARDAVEALALLDRPDGAIELLVTDVVMPGLDGFSFAHLVKGTRPEIAIVYLTGFCDLAEEMGERHGAIVKKPFRPRDLGAEISRALAA